MTAKDIDKHLRNHFENNSKYMVSNVYAFDEHYLETDFLVVKENGFVSDIEIKISKSDFKADFRKKKHEILRSGCLVLDKFYARLEEDNLIKYNKGDLLSVDTPNRFYFCCPENLISVDELPKYAGLFYVYENGSIKKIKEAQLLHKKRQLKEIEVRLCRKFYYSYLKLKQQNEK